jgi:hypothetical protein
MPAFDLLLAYWVRDGEWEVRIDGPHINPPLGQRHVHIRKRRGSKGEYSWNSDGTQHDKGNFPKNEKDIEAAKRIAADRLKINANTLKFMFFAHPPIHLIVIQLEGALHEVICRTDRHTIVLASDDWLLLVEIRNEDRA